MNPKYRVFAVLGLVFLLSLGFYLWTRHSSSDVILIGTVDANQVIVSSKVGGRLEHLLVDEGQPVKQGQLIAEIDKADLAAQRDAARATLDSMRWQVEQSGHSYTGTQNETGAQIANADAALRAAEAALEESRANERQQELDAHRTVSLADQGVASQQERDRAEQGLAAAQARVRTNEHQVDVARATLDTMKSHVHQAAAAQSNVAVNREQMNSARAKLNEAQVRIGYTSVTAPVSGVVSVRAAREGEVVNPGTPILTIVDLTQTWVYAAIP